MNLSVAEKKRQLQALLNAGILSKADFDQKVAALDAQPAAAAPPQGQTSQQGMRRDERGGGREAASRPRQTASRPNRPEFVKAPYRFVPFDGAALVMAEEEALAPIHEPKADGFCAELVVQWEAEGPLLVGEDKSGAGAITPMRWQGVLDKNGQPGGFFMPGSTLRGAIRSVAEIIGGGRIALAHVNTNHSFGLRDFTHRAYSNSREDLDGVQDSRFPLADPSKLKAGWLRLKDSTRVPASKADEAMLGGCFVIEPMPQWYRLQAEDLWRKRRPQGSAANASAFTKQKLPQKYRDCGLTVRKDGRDTIATSQTAIRFGFASPADRQVGGLVTIDANGPVSGHLVFSGASPSGKTYEYVFAGDAGAPVDVEPLFWERFVKSHAQAVKDKLKPIGGWEQIPEMFRANPEMRLPVFYVGDLDDQRAESFAFGITRLFKVPHVHSLSDVMAKSGVSDPVREVKTADDQTALELDRAAIDMVDALFGFVYEPKANKDKRAKQDTGEVARKGRVAFSSAQLVKGQPEISKAVETVMMGPRSSFAPFYLAGKVKDYSAKEVPTIAGRKRYPVRTHGVGPQEAFRSVKDRLEEQVRAIARMGKPPGPDVTTKLCFLLPKPGSDNLVFESRIRLFNVTKAELGLVLAAVTLGGQPERRHAIGRAKPFGAGQVKASVTGLMIEHNLTGRVDAPDAGAFLEAFKAHVAARLQDPARRAAHAAIVSSFYATCNPQTGAQLDKAGKLDYLRLRELPQGGNRDENPYVRLRDMVKPMKNAADPTTPARLLTITGS
jgi:CRISPR-associated protein (TIGR03986 family)